ncbi:ABC transporter substrate-binding protein [Microbacterium sp. SORGH_AS_0888]|uniref:ABC transporter substrate-binding protein n=1 Tax=Microbacterium sp. SORGH_AS_0888 TaxID=3041791 RepID=UPI0027825036|nr:ABC transporter substrate-binding protein [Microbacterium sp. SORGH_AS_0888]MDQ1130083.1 alpha-glucoside transport system substrate-binding protein [Microbacterium sp. SORGH_AS_0888]
MKLRSSLGAVATLALGAVVLAGCSSSTPNDQTSGSTVTIMGAFTDAQATAFQADLDAWSKKSGVTAKYEPSSDFQTAIIARAAAGNPPDIAIYPQPGVLKSQINQLYPLEDIGVDVAAITADEANGLGTIAQNDGKTYGLPYSINVKSLVWYNPSAFAAAGLSVPTTDAEMTALEKKIVDQGLGYPWCVGLESGGATGWPATDWLEEYVLRYGGLDEYDSWIAGDVKFNSSLVTKAGDKVAAELLAPGQINGGGPAAATTSFQTAGNQLFVDGKANGQCFMMRQGSFVADFFPDSVKAQIAKGDLSNIDFFQLPSPEGTDNAMLGGGDLVGAFSKTEATKKVVEYLTGKDFGTNGYAGQAIFLSPHGTFDTSAYTTQFQRKAQELLKEAKVFGFDASDQMPGEVGAGTEWTQLTSWFAGQTTMADAFTAIDASWPKR